MKLKGGIDMKLIVKISKIVMLILGAFFILMSFDVFDSSTSTVLERIGGFLIQSSPGTVLIALTIILWKKERILGIIILVSAIGLFFLFKLYQDLSEKWITFLIVEVPMLSAGGLLLGYKKT